MLPKITIVTVTYNAQDYLEKTIKSVIDQDYKNIEYIIIDGKSTDGTIDIIKKYEKYISYWVSEPDNGIYDAMNKAIKLAKGDWINFMNAGDSFADNFVISKMIPYIKKGKKVLSGYVNLIDQDNNWISTELPMNIKNITTEFRINHQATFIEMSIAKEHPYDLHYKYASDVDFFMKINLQEHNYGILPYPVVDFLLGGFWQQNELHANIEILNIISKHLKNDFEIFNHEVFLHIFLGLYKKHTNPNLTLNLLINKLLKELKSIKQRYEKIVLYGYGHLGKIIASHLKDNVIAIVDKNIHNDFILKPEQINHLKYDCILITVLGRETDILKYLMHNLKIEKNKIVTFSL